MSNPTEPPKEKSRDKRERPDALQGYSYNLAQSAFNARFKKPRILYDDNLNVRWTR